MSHPPTDRAPTAGSGRNSLSLEEKPAEGFVAEAKVLGGGLGDFPPITMSPRCCMSALSLESLMTLAQSASSAASQRAQQAQQSAQAQQAQQQVGIGGAAAPQAQPSQAPQMSSEDLEAAQTRNACAGEQWGGFMSDSPVEPAKAGADAQQRADLYADSAIAPDAAETAASTPTPAAPAFKTNQDLINHCYKVGGGTWEGASRVARENGTSLNALVRDRNGTPPITTPWPDRNLVAE